jgi:hypothetical protein
LILGMALPMDSTDGSQDPRLVRPDVHPDLEPTEVSRPLPGAVCGNVSREALTLALDPAGATAIDTRFQLALAWLTTGALLGAVLPVLGVAMIAALNAFYWLPIRGESPRPRPLVRRTDRSMSPTRCGPRRPGEIYEHSHGPASGNVP